MANVYILRYTVQYEGSGLINHAAYLSRSEAEAALELHRKDSRHYPEFTPEELMRGAEAAVAEDKRSTKEYEDLYGPTPSIHQGAQEIRDEYIANNSWKREEYIEQDALNPLVRWIYRDYACWIDELPVVNPRVMRL